MHVEMIEDVLVFGVQCDVEVHFDYLPPDEDTGEIELFDIRHLFINGFIDIDVSELAEIPEVKQSILEILKQAGREIDEDGEMSMHGV